MTKPPKFVLGSYGDVIRPFVRRLSRAADRKFSLPLKGRVLNESMYIIWFASNARLPEAFEYSKAANNDPCLNRAQGRLSMGLKQRRVIGQQQLHLRTQ